jgi:hypothetical protein
VTLILCVDGDIMLGRSVVCGASSYERRFFDTLVCFVWCGGGVD